MKRSVVLEIKTDLVACRAHVKRLRAYKLPVHNAFTLRDLI